MLFAGMEAELAALAEGQRDVIALSGVRGASPGLDHPVTAVVSWNREQSHYVVIAMPDFAARQVEILIGSERRARRLMEQQLEAASSEVRFASFARTRLRLARRSVRRLKCLQASDLEYPSHGSRHASNISAAKGFAVRGRTTG